MSLFDYGSIQVKSDAMIEVLRTAQKLQPNQLVFIVGKSGTGKSTLAQYIQKNIFKNLACPIYEELDDSDLKMNQGIFTISEVQAEVAFSKLVPNTFQIIEMPLLFHRKADLPQLAEFFLQVLSLMNNKPKVKLTDKALEKILQYGWPGQFAEFEHVLENAFMSAGNGLIEPEYLDMGPLKTSVGIPTGMKLEELERKYILQTLYFVHQNRTKAAEILGISIRTLRNKINQYRVGGHL